MATRVFGTPIDPNHHHQQLSHPKLREINSSVIASAQQAASVRTAQHNNLGARLKSLEDKSLSAAAHHGGQFAPLRHQIGSGTKQLEQHKSDACSWDQQAAQNTKQLLDALRGRLASCWCHLDELETETAHSIAHAASTISSESARGVGCSVEWEERNKGMVAAEAISLHTTLQEDVVDGANANAAMQNAIFSQIALLDSRLLEVARAREELEVQSTLQIESRELQLQLLLVDNRNARMNNQACFVTEISSQFAEIDRKITAEVSTWEANQTEQLDKLSCGLEGLIRQQLIEQTVRQQSSQALSEMMANMARSIMAELHAERCEREDVGSEFVALLERLSQDVMYS